MKKSLTTDIHPDISHQYYKLHWLQTAVELLKTAERVASVNLGIELSEVCNSCTSLIILLNKHERRRDQRTLPHVAHRVVRQRLEQSDCFLQPSPSTCHAQSQRCSVSTHAIYHIIARCTDHSTSHKPWRQLHRGNGYQHIRGIIF